MRYMSVAKPILEYIKTIQVHLDLQHSIKAFKRIMKYNKPYLHLIILIIILSSFRSYLFTLEPLYTAQIIDDVIVANDYDLLVGLLTKIFLAVAGFGVLNFIIVFINGYMAKRVVQDIRTDYYNALQ